MTTCGTLEPLPTFCIMCAMLYQLSYRGSCSIIHFLEYFCMSAGSSFRGVSICETVPHMATLANEDISSAAGVALLTCEQATSQYALVCYLMARKWQEDTCLAAVLIQHCFHFLCTNLTENATFRFGVMVFWDQVPGLFPISSDHILMCTECENSWILQLSCMAKELQVVQI